MALNIYDFLEERKRQNSFSRGSEATFFSENSYLLSAHEPFRLYLHPLTPFDICRSNILIRALVNKRVIERLYLSRARVAEKEGALSVEEFMEEAMGDLPYFSYDKEKIFVPFFSRALNRIYATDFFKMEVAPYRRLLRDFDSVIMDPFDYWGAALFDSYFTRLVKVKEHEGSLAMYDYDTERLYFITPQGRLENSLAFFDKDLRNPGKTHLMVRIEKVANAYFMNDQDAFYASLLSERLVSRESLMRYRKKRLKLGLPAPSLIEEKER